MFRRALIWFGVVALMAIAYISGNTVLRDALPILLTSFIAWLFARTLRAGRMPLIARAIVAIDGSQWLDDPAIARYARRLTHIWAAYLLALAAIAAVAAWIAAPAASRFGEFGVPLAVAALFMGEFAVRRRLLPQAPRHGFFAFARELIRHWPALLDDRSVALARENRDAGTCAMSEPICEHFHIAASHPALPGHFPGNPVVPGVVLLERVAAVIERAFGARVIGVPQVKFLRPLGPDEVAELRVERVGDGARFSVRREHMLLASGMLELAP